MDAVVSDFTVPQMIAAAAADLPEEGFTPEWLAVMCWQRFPASFGLKGFPHHPDHHKVLAALCGAKGLVSTGQLQRHQGGLLTLTDSGRAYGNEINEPDLLVVGSKPAKNGNGHSNGHHNSNGHTNGHLNGHVDRIAVIRAAHKRLQEAGQMQLLCRKCGTVSVHPALRRLKYCQCPHCMSHGLVKDE